MDTIIFRNATILTPLEEIHDSIVAISGDKITFLGKESDFPESVPHDSCEIIDLQGYLLVPGFFDIHTHGLHGYNTQTDYKEQILEIARLHRNSGVSRIILTLYPSSIERMRMDMETVRKAIQKQKFSEGEYIRGTAEIIGVYLEGPFLNPEQSGALDGSSFREPDGHTLEELTDGYEDLIKIITISPELQGACELIRKIADKGILVSMGHSNATFTEAEAGFNAGAKGITHIFNAMRGFHHREPGIAGFGLLNQDIYIEVIGDPYHLNQRTLELIFRIKNQERIIIVSDSVKETGMNGHTAPVSDASGRLIGGSTTVTESFALLSEKGFDKHVLMDCVTRNPDRYLSNIH